MHDPMALVTDSALAIVAWGLSLRLHRARAPWGAAFLFTGVAAFLGAIYHGVFEHLYLWKAVLCAVGVASFFLLMESEGRIVRTFATVKLVAYLTWASMHSNQFVFAIIDYGVTLTVILILHTVRDRPGTRWVLAAIGVSVAGAVVQQQRVTLHPYWFDHNDLYHVVQMGALWMLYLAAMDSRTGPNSPVPSPGLTR